MIALASGVALGLAGALLLVRFVLGPGPVDRVLSAYGVLLCAALLAATLTAVDVRWVGAALALVLLGVVVVVAAIRATGRQTFQTPLASLDDGASL